MIKIPILLQLGVAALALCNAPSSAFAQQKPTWTIMIYGNADHNLSPSLVVDFLEMQKCGSSSHFNIVLQTDFDQSSQITYQVGLPSRFGIGTTRWLVSETRSKRIDSHVLLRSPEINSDHEDRLTGFIEWTLRRYPADRYGLILWDHGGSWSGFGGDQQDGTRPKPRGMKLNQIEKGLERALAGRVKKLDFLSLDACLMANQEAIAQLARFAKLYIACGEIDYGNGWDYEAALSWLKKHPGASMREFGEAEVRSYAKHHDSLVDQLFMSHGAFDLSLAPEFTKDASRFADSLRLKFNNRAMKAQRDASPYFIAGLTQGSLVAGFYDLVEMARSLAADKQVAPSLRARAAHLARTANKMRIAKAQGDLKKRAGGINVYNPLAPSEYPSFTIGRFENLNADSQIRWSRVIHAARKAKSSAPLPRIQVSDGPTRNSFVVRSLSENLYQISGVITRRMGEREVMIGEAGRIKVDGQKPEVIAWDRQLPCVQQGGKRVFLPTYQAPQGPILTARVQLTLPEGLTIPGSLTLGYEKRKISVISIEAGPEVPRGFVPPAGTVVTPLFQEVGGLEEEEVPGEQSFTIPKGGIQALRLNFEKLDAGDYTLRLQGEDSFGKKSNLALKTISIR